MLTQLAFLCAIVHDNEGLRKRLETSERNSVIWTLPALHLTFFQRKERKDFSNPNESKFDDIYSEECGNALRSDTEALRQALPLEKASQGVYSTRRRARKYARSFHEETAR